ncbi:glycoside hydrolase family 88 protein [Bacteroidales bacterium OttesenSCG-928-A17]|nr:glycoside hydrolase family 88 protein [Bacteroidales bacterium OttesenSCG-928-A17]
MRYLSFFVACLLLVACGGPKTKELKFIDENIEFARQQIGMEIDTIESSGKFLNPTTLKKDGSVHYCGYADWRSGFFPGSVWYLYELTGDEYYRQLAEKYSAGMEEAKNLTWHHDVGFMIYCSSGNGLRLTGDAHYKEVVVQAARSLSTRFRPVAGVIQSWDVNRGWMSQRGWECPVIIDNMMNLELMFEATKLTGDSSFWEIAIAHADRTLTEHFRPDGSCYHVIDYSLEDGSVRNRHTAQGFAHESAWSRGQAWAIYGYTICYRETGDRKYIDQALKTFHFMRDHKNAPEDLIPYWDMDAPDIPNALRDASSASCMASALYEISTMDVADAAGYKLYADRIMETLASPVYRAELGTNGHFLLMHSVGSIPHNAEVDKPLNYADYYFLEALKRKREIETGESFAL